MSDKPYVDFAALKEAVSIEQCVQMLGVQMRQHGHQFRSVCPVHGGGERTLVVTPGKGFYCFASSKGGDQIQLVSHVRECSPREAAEEMQKHFRIGQPAPATKQPTAGIGMKPLDHIEHDHPAVEAVGFDTEVAEAVGIGHTGKGTMKGLVAVPIRLQDGTLVGYIGIEEARMPPKWQLPVNNVVPIPKRTA